MRRTISHPSCCREPMVPAGSTETGQQTSWCCRCRNFASKQGWSQGKAVPTYHQAPWRYKCVQGEGKDGVRALPSRGQGQGFTDAVVLPQAPAQTLSIPAAGSCWGMEPPPHSWGSQPSASSKLLPAASLHSSQRSCRLSLCATCQWCVRSFRFKPQPA